MLKLSRGSFKHRLIGWNNTHLLLAQIMIERNFWHRLLVLSPCNRPIWRTPPWMKGVLRRLRILYCCCHRGSFTTTYVGFLTSSSSSPSWTLSPAFPKPQRLASMGCLDSQRSILCGSSSPKPKGEWLSEKRDIYRFGPSCRYVVFRREYEIFRTAWRRFKRKFSLW